ncbi:Uncharacterised protein [Yersinia enterocolitica]|nr:hypothetical protein CH47_50 [Yersinia enterocolitica]VTP82963.1 Uncharacterised protein [Yersinia enterocolitica subsp. enterocolitica]AJJ22016.1 hypothetical protein CH49_3016 [Yersinia enterocolitica]KGA68929.1 hypothetical protein DJ59_1920 [Yersinia enterocolitica]KGA78230.1 hypothetical protein DJ60_3406 [Yersinia enterocolitica]
MNNTRGCYSILIGSAVFQTQFNQVNFKIELGELSNLSGSYPII